MRLKFILGLIGIICATLTISAQDNSKHPIDVALEKCLKTAKATMPRAECYATASEAWKNAVDADYQKLLKQFSPDLKKILEAEQSAWNKYREQRDNYVMGKYGRQKGTGYISVRITQLMKPYKERALDLEDRIEN